MCMCVYVHCTSVCVYICVCVCTSVCVYVCCGVQELVVALSGFVCQFETQFASLAHQLTEAEKEREYHTVTGTVGVWNSPNGLYYLLFPVKVSVWKICVDVLRELSGKTCHVMFIVCRVQCRCSSCQLHQSVNQKHTCIAPYVTVQFSSLTLFMPHASLIIQDYDGCAHA